MGKRDIHQEVTNKIIEQLESVDSDNFQMPFAVLAEQGLPFNPITQAHYQGINVPSLWCDQQRHDFPSSEWATFNQWKQKGVKVRKGERGSPIIFYKSLNKQQENERGEQEDVSIPLLRFYTVFNASQVEGYEPQSKTTEPRIDLVERLETVDTFCTNTGAAIRHGSSTPYYDRAHDYINMPDTVRFRNTDDGTATEHYYAILLHELTHWTGAPKRLARDKAKTKAELQKYAFEELIAELGAAFLCAGLKITPAHRETHAAYIKHWLKALHDDKKFIFKASAQAASAVEYLHSFQTP